jgi:hypothetical protein
MKNTLIQFIREDLPDDEQHRVLQAEQSMVIRCGQSSIILHADGLIELRGKGLRLNGETITLFADRINLDG